MNKIKKIVGLAVSSALLLSAVPFAASADDSDTVFVTMNIPYSAFYQADVKNNDVEVDAVTSATDSKWKSFSGTYFVPDAEGVGGKILGVSFPVEVSREDYSKLNVVSDENADYYFTDLEGTPSVYKTLTVNDNGAYEFSEVQGNKEVVSGTNYTLATESVWGDYLFEFSDVTIDGTVYGIVVTTNEGSQYGMRHLENIWKKAYEFAWGSGIKEADAKGNVFSYEHYQAMMGQTISDVTYITDKGIISYPVNSYVPVKITTVVTVENAGVNDKSTKVSFNPGLPSDYNASYTVGGLKTEYNNGVLSYTDAKAGSYTLTVSDSNGKYADLLSSFTLSTDVQPAAYDNKEVQLVAVEGLEDDFSAFLKNLTNVNVDGQDYTASGKRAVPIIGADGKIDLEAAGTNGVVFDTVNKDTFNVVVSSAGYPDLAFTISTKEQEGFSSDTDSTSTDTSSDSDTASDSDSDTSSDKSSDTDTSSDSDTDTSSDKSSDTDSTGSSSTVSSTSTTTRSSSSSSTSTPTTSGNMNVLAVAITSFASLLAAGIFFITKSKKVNK